MKTYVGSSKIAVAIEKEHTIHIFHLIGLAKVIVPYFYQYVNFTYNNYWLKY